VHSAARPVRHRFGWWPALFCMVACGDVADEESAVRVQHGQRACVHFEREPGAEGDAEC